MSFASRLLSHASEIVTHDQLGCVARGQLIAIHVPKNGQFDIGVDSQEFIHRFKTGGDLYSGVAGVRGVRIGATVAGAVAAQERQHGGKFLKRTDDTEVVVCPQSYVELAAGLVVVLIRERLVVQALCKVAEGAILHAEQWNIAHMRSEEHTSE